MSDERTIPQPASELAEIIERVAPSASEGDRGNSKTTDVWDEIMEDIGEQARKSQTTAVMSSMETETDPLPDAVAAAWDVELDPPEVSTGSLAEWRDGDDEFNILVTKLSVARILNRKCIDLLKRWLELDGDKDDIERLIHDTREALH